MKTKMKVVLFLIIILAMLGGSRLFARAEGSNAIHMPFLAKSSTCNVPSASYPTIQNAINIGCTVINLTASDYIENVVVQNHTVTIRGQGPNNTAVDGNGIGSVFQVNDDAEMTLEGVTVRNGYNSTYEGGGGIRNWGSTNISDTVISDNLTDNGPGGGIASDGALTVYNSWISNNTIQNEGVSAYGGGIFVGTGTAHIENTIVNGNETTTYGGGIYTGRYLQDVTVSIINAQISDNIAGYHGGGVTSYFDGSIFISNSLISNNVAHSHGGGILNVATMQLVDSQIVGNTVNDGFSCGGGIMNASDDGESDLLVERVEIRDNFSLHVGGGICNSGSSSKIVVNESLVVGNSTTEKGGGLINSSSIFAYIYNSTFYNNVVLNPTFGQGGALFNYDDLFLINVTLNQNEAQEGASIYSEGDMRYVNTIITGGFPGGNCAFWSSGSLITMGYNISDDDSCDLNGAGDMPNSDPLLGPLQNNGGPTETMALLVGSPAIDMGDDGMCPAIDQRGVIRPQGPGCDIGAYEYDG